MRLRGKVAIVTGAGTGLGRAIALMSFGRLDILVNNAGGIAECGPVLGMTEDGFRKTLDINVTSAFLCSRPCRS